MKHILVLCKPNFWLLYLNEFGFNHRKITMFTGDRVTTMDPDITIYRADKMHDIVGMTLDSFEVFGLWDGQELADLMVYAMQGVVPK